MFKYCFIFFACIFYSRCFCQQQGQVVQFEDGSYCAAIRSDVFKYYVAKQEKANWCWAACTQMVLNYQGVQITQEDIVEKAFGALVDKPAGADVIARAANGWNYNGTSLKAWADYNISPSTISLHKLIDALAYKYPVIIGLKMPGQTHVGHAYVLTAIYYRKNGDIKSPFKVALRDPWPTNPSRLELSWDDFVNRINCIVHVTH